MTHAWAKLARLTGAASGSTRNSMTPAPMNGTTWAAVISRPLGAGPLQALGVDARAPVDGRQLGERLDGHGRGVLAAGDRQAHDHELGVEGSSRTCSAWPSPVLTIAK